MTDALGVISQCTSLHGQNKEGKKSHTIPMNKGKSLINRELSMVKGLTEERKGSVLMIKKKKIEPLKTFS